MKSISILLASLTALAAGAAIPADTNTNTAPLTSRAFGVFLYSYTDDQGVRQQGDIVDPPSGQCINIEEATAEPADSPINDTEGPAIVFLEKDCQGDTVFRVGPGRVYGPRLKLRSVVFPEGGI